MTASCVAPVDGSQPTTGADTPVASVRGHLAEGTQLAAAGLAGQGTRAAASKVVMSRLSSDGVLTEVATVEVRSDGTFDLPIANTSNPGDVLIMQVQDITGAILASTVLNGIPAFFKGFFIDVPIDTATSFKTEILMTMANGGVPGVRNYLNVVNAFVDAELAGDIAVFDAFVLDFNMIFGAFATAAITTQGLIDDQLEQAGFPIDSDAIEAAQLMALAGFEGQVTTAAGNVVTNSKNLIAQLQEAANNAAKPIDDALFNVLVGGGTMFKTTAMAKTTALAPFAFPMVKAGFKLQTAVALDQIHDQFAQAGVDGQAMAELASASATLTAAAAQATDSAGLTAAKTQFKTSMFGQPDAMQGSLLAQLAKLAADLRAALLKIQNLIAPLAADLETALTAANPNAPAIAAALAQFDAGAADLPATFATVTSAQNADAFARAFARTEKVVVP